MALEFPPNEDWSFGYMVSSGYVELPPSDVGDHVLLCVGFGNRNGASTTISTPTVNGVAGSPRGSHCWSWAGGTSGQAYFTFPTNIASFWAYAFKVTGAEASPFSLPSSASTSGFGHALNAVNTAPFIGAAFLGVAVSPDSFSGGYFESANNIAVFGNEIEAPLLSIAVHYAQTAGAAGGHVWQKVPTDSFGGVFGSLGGFWISPIQAPSAPVVTLPLTSSKATIGATVRIAYDPATDPVVDTEDLIYKIYDSDNNGNSYSLIHTTAAGVLFYDWDTTGVSAGNHKIKVVANNVSPGNDGEPGYSGTFQLFYDVPPGAPTNLLPTGYISQATKDFTWVGSYPDFDSQYAYELRYSVNADMSSPTSTGKITSPTALKNFTASGGILSSLGTKYWDVATYGVVDDTLGARSAVQTVIVAAAPATPTITSSSTANVSNWVVTYSGITHTKFRHRWVLSGAERFNSVVQSSAFAFVSPFPLANGAVWDVYVSVFDPASGLESAEAHQTLTVSYTGPSTPTLIVTALANGAIQLEITNPGTAVDHNRIYRGLSGSGEYVLISPKLGSNGLYLDHQTRADLASPFDKYEYFVRAFKPTTFGFTDSITHTVGGQWDKLFLHVADKTSVTSNARLPVALLTQGEIVKKFVKNHRSVAYDGRSKFITHAGQAKHCELTYQVMIPRAEVEITFTELQALYDANATLFVKDGAGNGIFGRMSELPKTDFLADVEFSLTFTESNFQEHFTR